MLCLLFSGLIYIVVDKEQDDVTTFVKSTTNDVFWNKDIWNIDYQAILPLRCLLAKETSSWDYLQKFMDHCEVSI